VGFTEAGTAQALINSRPCIRLNGQSCLAHAIFATLNSPSFQTIAQS
jgi:hypothetical protein